MTNPEKCGEFFCNRFQHLLESKPNSIDLEQCLAAHYEDLGWQHCHHFHKRSLPAKFPPDYEPF
jgi:hypothetical protein